MRGNLARLRADLLRWVPPPAPVAPPDPAAQPAPPAPPAQPAQAPPEQVPLWHKLIDEAFEGAALAGAENPFSLENLVGQTMTPGGLAGVRLLAQAGESDVLLALSHLMSMQEAAVAGRWTEKAERELAELERKCDQISSQPSPSLTDRAKAAWMLAMGHVVRWQLRSRSPQLTERPPAGEGADLVTELEAALDLVAAAAKEPGGTSLGALQGLLHVTASSILTDLARAGGHHPDPELIRRSRAHMAQVPAELIERLPPIMGDIFLLQEILADRRRVTPEESARLANRFGEMYETSGAPLAAAEAAVAEAKTNLTPQSLGVALNELNQAGISLPAGSPLHFRRLILLAETQTLSARRISDPNAMNDAVGTALDAGQLASTPAERRAVAQQLVLILGAMASRGFREGPFRQVEDFLRTALADAAPDDWALRVIATVGLGATVDLRAPRSGDQRVSAEAIRFAAEAEALLPRPEPTDDWYAAAHSIYVWTAMCAIRDPGAGLAPVALRIGELMEGMLVSAASDDASAEAGPFAPQLKLLRQGRAQLLAEVEHASQDPVRVPAAGRGPAAKPAGAAAEDPYQLGRRIVDQLAVAGDYRGLGRPGPHEPATGGGARLDQAGLQNAVTELHSALAGVHTDPGLRREIDEALGRCAAELYWAWPQARTMEVLREAIVHLNRAATAGARQLPTPERADLLAVLACCRREVAGQHEVEAERVQARVEADRAARAAIRELARCALLCEETVQALTFATRANELVARSIGWCLSDGNARAAVEIAEAGRGLVLAGVVLTGHLDEVLRGAGEHQLADAWRQGSREGRIAALDAMWRPDVSARWLAAPTVDQIALALATTAIDAVVYLVPPAAEGTDRPSGAAPVGWAGHAVLVRPLLSEVEVLDLPGLGGVDREPLDSYLAAFDGALGSFDADTANEEGFRGGPGGAAWTGALVGLGAWTYQRIMGPLIEHVRGWNLGHRPHLALIPLGELAAIPYAAAWIQDPRSTGSRRYAIDDVALTYAASARLLGEVSRRGRQPLAERVVLVSDPTGEFTMSRVAARQLAAHLYPQAEIYGLKSAPHGPATTEALLGALPRADRPGASLLHLVTHGSADPVPQVQTFDGWLALDRILEQARGRSPDAQGGLVITNACLTDSTRADYDESMTLATAFLAAGACSIIGTRWPVDDDTTAALSLRLHYHLHLGRPPAEALRHAQLDLLRPTPVIRKSLGPHLSAIDEARLSHPVSWAGYVHHGSDTRETT
jgi:CHAT domain